MTKSAREKHQEILICGLGKSGVASARLALRQGYKCYLSDSSLQSLERKEIQQLIEEGAEFCDLPYIQTFENCVMSPGISPQSELYQAAKKASVNFMGELDFAAKFMPQTKFLAITGTNGKTTCTEMTQHTLKNLAYEAVACGNIGLPLAEVALQDNQPEFAVVEISSYQIDLLHSLKFDAAIILNVSEDHMDRYGTFEKYLDSKLRIRKFCHFLAVQQDVECIEADMVFSVDSEEAGLAIRGNILHLKDQEIPLPNFSFYGKHNLENALGGLALLNSQKIDLKESLQAMSDFTCSEHRLEEFATYQNVLYINDSKSTNPASLMVALETFADKNKKIVLIAGGRDKNMDLSVVNPLISKYVREVFSYGECKENLKALWNGLCPINLCADFEGAVLEAIRCSKEGDVVLLSPGCSSLDLFKSFEERGKKFKSLVQKVNE